MIRIDKRNIKTAETYNSCGIYISNEILQEFIRNAGYEEYLDTTRYESDITKNMNAFSKGYGCFTKEKLFPNIKVEHPMIFYAEAHLFKTIGKNYSTYMVFFFKEKTLDHRTFDLTKPILVKKDEGFLSKAKTFIENAYLGKSWTTEGRFDSLDEAINSLNKDIKEQHFD